MSTSSWQTCIFLLTDLHIFFHQLRRSVGSCFWKRTKAMSSSYPLELVDMRKPGDPFGSPKSHSNIRVTFQRTQGFSSLEKAWCQLKKTDNSGAKIHDDLSDPLKNTIDSCCQCNGWLKSQQQIQAEAGPWSVLLSTNKLGIQVPEMAVSRSRCEVAPQTSHF